MSAVRLGNGEGSIYQLADGCRRAQATIMGKRAGVYGKTRKEAQTKLQQVLGDADRVLLSPAEKVPVE